MHETPCSVLYPHPLTSCSQPLSDRGVLRASSLQGVRKAKRADACMGLSLVSTLGRSPANIASITATPLLGATVLEQEGGGHPMTRNEARFLLAHCELVPVKKRPLPWLIPRNQRQERNVGFWMSSWGWSTRLSRKYRLLLTVS